MEKIKNKLIFLLIITTFIVFIFGNYKIFADNTTTYKIIINNDNENISIIGNTYNVYKIFNVSYNSAKTDYSYTLAEEFKDFTYSKTITDSTTQETKTYNISELEDFLVYLEKADNEQINEFAEASKKYIDDNSIKESATATAEKETLDIDVTVAGYYLVTGTVTSTNNNQSIVAALGLTTTDPSGEINVKADAPTIDKIIVNADDTTNSKGTSVNVGDVVTFKLTSAIPNMNQYDEYKYIIHDTLSSGLTYDSETGVKVTIDGEEYTDITTTKDANQDKTTSLTVTLNNLVSKLEDKTLNVGDKIEITYSAKVNNLALSTNYETNTVYLEYSSDPYTSTSTSQTTNKVVYIYDFDIVIDKFKKGYEDTKLDDAEFELYKNVNNKKYYYYVLTDGIVTWSEDSATRVITDDKGYATFTGIDSGEYYLKETTPPDGYNQAKDTKVEITSTYNTNGILNSTSATSTNNGQYKQTVKVANNAGFILPSTGGAGIYGFYIVGSICLILSGTYLVFAYSRKKKNINPSK